MDGPWNMLSFVVTLLVWGRFATGAVEIGWSVETMSVDEGSFSPKQMITRSSPTGQHIVSISFKDVTAKEGFDYGIGSNTDVVFRNGDSFKDYYFHIQDDIDVEEVETFELTLSSTDSDVTIIKPTLTVSINMDDKAKFEIKYKGEVTEENVYGAVITRTECWGCNATISIKCSAESDEAISGTDFTAVSNQIVTFKAEDNEMTCKIPTLADDLIEGAEDFKIKLATDSTIATIVLSNQVVTIKDEDRVTTQFKGSDTYTVSEDGGKVTLTMEMIGKELIKDTLTVQLVTIPGTAGAKDYGGLNGFAVSFKAGTSTMTEDITIKTDDIPEGKEKFEVKLQLNAISWDGGMQKLGSFSKVTIFITDTPDKATFTFKEATIEVAEESSTLKVPIKQETATELNIVIKVEVTGGSAKVGDDFTFNNAVTFGNTVSEESLVLNIIDNDDIDGDRTINLKLTSPDFTDNVEWGSTTECVVTIKDTDLVTYQFKQTAVTVNEDVGKVTLDIERTNPAPTKAVDLKINTKDDSATSGEDFTGLSDEVKTMAIADKATTVDVVITDDDIVEGTQQLKVVMTEDYADVRIGTRKEVIITILDNDLQETFSLKSATLEVEEDAGTVDIIVTKAKATQSVTLKVNLTVTDGTAKNGMNGLTGADYKTQPLYTELEFAPSDTSKTLSIPLFNDDIVELNKTFTVTLTTNEARAKIGDHSVMTVKIVNDDKEIFELSPTAYELYEDTGEVNVTITKAGKATLPEHVLTILLTTVDDTATASSGDFPKLTGQQITFAPMETTKNVTVYVTVDKILEHDEIFKVKLVPFDWDTKIGSNQEATIKIWNEDRGNVTFNETVYTFNEGDGAVLNFGCSGNNDIDMNFNLKAMPIMANNTLSEKADYTLADGQAVKCSPRVTGVTYTVPLTDDVNAEWPETFHVNMSTSQDHVDLLVTEATVTIVDDEDKVDIGIKHVEYNLTEADCHIVVTLEKTPNTEVDITVKVSSMDIMTNSTGFPKPSPKPPHPTFLKNYTCLLNTTVSSNTTNTTYFYNSTCFYNYTDTSYKCPPRASTIQDFEPYTLNITFAPSETERTFLIPMTDDDFLEYNETFKIVLESLTPNKTKPIVKNETIITIYNDDIATLELVERLVSLEEAQAMVKLTVRLLGKTLIPVYYNISTMNSTAIDSRDFPRVVKQTYSFRPSPSGESTMQIEVNVTDELLVEYLEQFDIVLTTEQPFVYVVESMNTSEVQIINDDHVMVGFINTAQSVNESQGYANVCVMVVRGERAIPVSYNVSTYHITTTVGRDFVTLSNFTVTIPYGTNTSCFTVTIRDDDVAELDETFGVKLYSGKRNVVIDQTLNSYEITILNDDSVTMEFHVPENTSVSEGDRTLVTVVVNGKYDIPLSVWLYTMNESSTAYQDDYNLTSIVWPQDMPSLPGMPVFPDWELPIPANSSHNLTIVFNMDAKNVSVVVDTISDRLTESREWIVWLTQMWGCMCECMAYVDVGLYV
ncbi:adhesion G-protein coupled receptor V1 [Nematostella vectensis]|uniref:adhesion G-protein coupled receptor V1 n=1 Tax=Nematostella vectensis TaxID=45351 RepID=UPI0020776EFD|nr:adhesion G-protein coupled receptor V1 [Nematostella vectensis]